MSALPAISLFTPSGAALIASPNGALRQEVLHRLNGRYRPVQQASSGADALVQLETRIGNSFSWTAGFRIRTPPLSSP